MFEPYGTSVYWLHTRSALLERLTQREYCFKAFHMKSIHFQQDISMSLPGKWWSLNNLQQLSRQADHRG